jgi:hypothetical protein
MNPATVCRRLLCVLLFACSAALAAAAPQAPMRHALLIGVSTYADPSIPVLAGVRHDMTSARTIARALGIPADQVTELRDAQATKAAIVAALRSLSERSGDAGRVLVYFSGHGTRWLDAQAGGCVEGLLTYDGQSIVNREFAELAAPLGARADKLVVMFDACHSGGVSALRGTTRSVRPGLQAKYFVKAGEGPQACSQPVNVRTRSLLGSGSGGNALAGLRENVVHITSSRPDEVSFDDAEQGGLATQAVRDCLLGRARDLDGSGAVTLAEVEQCAREFVREKLRPYPELLPHHVNVSGLRNLIPVMAAPAAAATPAPPVAASDEQARRIERERLQRDEQARLEAQRLEEQRQAALRAELLRQEQERLAAEREAAERARRAELERLERQAQAQREFEQAERQRLEAERQALAAAERAQAQREREQQAMAERERAQQERARLERERIERELQLARQREQQQREQLAAEQRRLEALARAEQEARENLAREQAEREQQARELEERARLALAPAAGSAVAPAASPAPAQDPSVAPVGSIAALRDLYEQRDRRRIVQARPSRPTLRIGRDRLDLTVTSSHDGHLYIVMLGSDETSFYLLYPNALDKDNRIRARVPVKLPRPSWELMAAGPPGTDHLLVVVAEQPRDLALLGTAGSDPSMPFTFRAADRDGRRALIDFMTGAGIAQGSSRFGAHWISLQEVP